MEIVIRDYKSTDLNDVNYILDEVFSVKKNNFTGKEFHEIVATIDNKICGYLLMTKIFNPILNKYYYKIDYVSVLENYRGLGIGTKLIKYSENIARNDNTIYLELTSGYQRKDAHRLYENCGFERRESYIYRKGLL